VSDGADSEAAAETQEALLWQATAAARPASPQLPKGPPVVDDSAARARLLGYSRIPVELPGSCPVGQGTPEAAAEQLSELSLQGPPPLASTPGAAGGEGVAEAAPAGGGGGSQAGAARRRKPPAPSAQQVKQYVKPVGLLDRAAIAKAATRVRERVLGG
jgi:hypothetical protein